ncbi:MAG TPA: hypothetical protein VJB59_10420 [Bdellovibrionota bacterium]|nr:hypothetical protein [Bdellovibrionota bacterium]
MKRYLVLLASLAAMTTLTGCKEMLFLNTFVEKYVEIEASKAQPGVPGVLEMNGKLVFLHTEYFTNYRTVCDTEICGYDEVYRCHTHERCVKNDHGVDQCSTYETCGYESVPRYCEVNCRQEPFTDSSTSRTISPIIVNLHGVDAKDAKKIKEVALAVKTNHKFREALQNQENQHKKARSVLKSLNQDANTILVLKAKGYRLSPQENFLSLATDFNKGDKVVIHVNVESTGSKETAYSGLGSKDDFPELHTSSYRD